MTLDQIKALLAKHSIPSDWRQLISEDGSSSSFCIADVNLRLESKVVWQQQKPYLRYTFSYGSTPISSWLLPLGPKRDHFGELITRCAESVRQGGSPL
jgi:hypothetical protein